MTTNIIQYYKNIIQYSKNPKFMLVGGVVQEHSSHLHITDSQQWSMIVPFDERLIYFYKNKNLEN
jgi:hypothetical protein